MYPAPQDIGLAQRSDLPPLCRAVTQTSAAAGQFDVQGLMSGRPKRCLYADRIDTGSGLRRLRIFGGVGLYHLRAGRKKDILYIVKKPSLFQ